MTGILVNVDVGENPLAILRLIDSYRGRKIYYSCDIFGN
jgi:hypothetical protein